MYGNPDPQNRPKQTIELEHTTCNKKDYKDAIFALEKHDAKMEDDLEMYILIREEIPIDIVPLIATHIAMITYKKFKDYRLMQKWFETKLQKTVICKVTRAQFEKAKEYDGYFALSEVHHQDFGELGLGFKIEEKYPKFFKFLKRYWG